MKLGSGVLSFVRYKRSVEGCLSGLFLGKSTLEVSYGETGVFGDNVKGIT